MTFQRDNSYLYYRIAITHILCLIIVLFQKDINVLGLFVIWILTAVLPNLVLLFSRSLKRIEINPNSVSLIFSKGFDEIMEDYEYHNLDLTYKTEMGGKGSKNYEFRIYKKDKEKSIISIGADFDGWTDSKIADILSELKNKGITILE